MTAYGYAHVTHRLDAIDRALLRHRRDLDAVTVLSVASLALAAVALWRRR